MSAPILYVATFGAAGSGQSTLADALVLRQDRRYPTDPRDEERHGVRGVSYRSERRRYRHVDCEGHNQHMRYLLAQEPIPDGVIVVAAADVGVTAELRDQLMVASKVGVPRAVAFLSKTDVVTDAARLDAIERDVRQALADADYPADDVPVVRGDLQTAKASRGEDDQACACVDALIEAMEAAMPTPELPWRERILRQPFLMSVDDVYLTFNGERLGVSGDIEKGSVKRGDTVEVVGLRETVARAQVGEISDLDLARSRESASAGQFVSLILQGIQPSDLERGQVLAAPGTIAAHRRFAAVVLVRPQREGGGPKLVVARSIANFHIRGVDVPAVVQLSPGRGRCRPREWTELTAELPGNRLFALEPGMTFAVGRAQGFGRVTRVLD